VARHRPRDRRGAARQARARGPAAGLDQRMDGAGPRAPRHDVDRRAHPDRAPRGRRGPRGSPRWPARCGTWRCTSRGRGARSSSRSAARAGPGSSPIRRRSRSTGSIRSWRVPPPTSCWPAGRSASW
jgi:hypothetical protein